MRLQPINPTAIRRQPDTVNPTTTKLFWTTVVDSLPGDRSQSASLPQMGTMGTAARNGREENKPFLDMLKPRTSRMYRAGKSWGWSNSMHPRTTPLPAPKPEDTWGFFATVSAGERLDPRCRSSVPSTRVRRSIFAGASEASCSREGTKRQTKRIRPFQTRRKRTAFCMKTHLTYLSTTTTTTIACRMQRQASRHLRYYSLVQASSMTVCCSPCYTSVIHLLQFADIKDSLLSTAALFSRFYSHMIRTWAIKAAS